MPQVGQWLTSFAAASLIALSLMGTAAAASAETGLWISRAEIARLPNSGDAWDEVVETANESAANPNVSDQNDPTNIRVLAKAYVHIRTGDVGMRDDVIQACRDVIGSEAGSRTLALGREVLAYVIAADLVGLPADLDADFRAWLQDIRTRDFQDKTLISTHEDRPNNWGTVTGATRMAIAIYLGDFADLDRAADVFHGWLGNRSVYAGFKYGDLDWQVDPDKPVGINPRGTTKEGHSVDGILPEEMRRSGSFTWPPPHENYVWSGLQGAMAQAVILHRAGYDVWSWEDQALLRAFDWLHDVADYPAVGDDTWQPHLINHYYGTDFPAPVPSRPGKNMGLTDWTHAGEIARVQPLAAPTLLP
jgi:hypothetical protein